MAFTYITPTTEQMRTPTYESKTMLVKSFRINIAGGSGGTHAVTYPVAMLPKNAQVVYSLFNISAAISGGGISASTLAIAVGGQNWSSGVNVFTTGVTSGLTTNAYIINLDTITKNDQLVTYTFTHTGGTVPTGGNIWVTLGYVI